MTWRVWLLLVLMLFSALAIYVAGAVLVVKNESTSEITNITVQYARGEVTIDRLAPGDAFKTRLGKIGEGSDFKIRWTESNYGEKKASFYIYFYDFELFDDIAILVTNDGANILYEDRIPLEYGG